VLTGIAHTAVCVPDVEEAVHWYTDVLGLRLLSPPYTMEGAQIEEDMGELVPPPVVVKAAVVGVGLDDRVIELIEYPRADVTLPGSGKPSVTRIGITHVGLVCEDLASTRTEFEQRGIVFLTSGIAQVAGLRTTWCCDPWGTVIILLEKHRADRPYWNQPSGG
jgi:hypothetical protein